jgi:hypothetical protein
VNEQPPTPQGVGGSFFPWAPKAGVILQADI